MWPLARLRIGVSVRRWATRAFVPLEVRGRCGQQRGDRVSRRRRAMSTRCSERMRGVPDPVLNAGSQRSLHDGDLARRHRDLRPREGPMWTLRGHGLLRHPSRLRSEPRVRRAIAVRVRLQRCRRVPRQLPGRPPRRPPPQARDARMRARQVQPAVRRKSRRLPGLRLPAMRRRAVHVSLGRYLSGVVDLHVGVHQPSLPGGVPRPIGGGCRQDGSMGRVHPSVLPRLPLTPDTVTPPCSSRPPRAAPKRRGSRPWGST